MSGIEGVLRRLDLIIDEQRGAGSRLGYFPALYRRVTQRVKEAIADGRFEDPSRMERFDVIFAQYYLDAWEGYKAGTGVPRSWRIAFDAAEARKLPVLTHLLLGMNAHIHLDLGIAAARVSVDSDYDSLYADYLRINDIIASELDPTENAVAEYSPAIWLLDWLMGRWDERLGLSFIQGLRESSWRFGRRLAALPGEQWLPETEARDAEVAALAAELAPSDPLRRLILAVVAFFERKDVSRNIDALR